MFGDAFGNFVDHAFNEDTLGLLILLVVPGVHIAAVVAAFKSRLGTRALAAVNLVVSGVILFYIASQPVYIDELIEGTHFVRAPAIFELVALVAAVAALWRIRLAIALSCAIFAAHFIASGMGVAFMLLFNYTR